MRDIANYVPGLAVLLGIAVLGAGCNQVFGLDETTESPQRAYTCDCDCTGGGKSFDVHSAVCFPEDLNPALNPDLPSDFEPPAAALQDDCHTRVERNLEQMARQCVADRIRCSCEATVGLVDSFFDCDTHCFGNDLAADCSNFDPQNGNVTATNVPGEEPVCVTFQTGSIVPPPAPFAAAILGSTSQCQVDGAVTVTRDGDTRTPAAGGVVEFTGTPCPGASCAVGVSYQLDHVDDFSFSGFAGFASVEFKDISSVGASGPGAAIVDATGVGAFAPATMSNTGSGRRSNQVLGGEVSSDSAAYTGVNGAPLGVVVDWANHSCALSGALLGSLEDADTAVDVNLAGTILNEPPTARAGATPRTVECTSPAGADVTLDGSATTDPDDNIALFAWRRGNRVGPEVGADSIAHVTQPLGGAQTYLLTVVDTLGQASADATAVTVVDTTPPAVTSVTASPSRLWPPNHKMVPVTVTTSAADVCGAASCEIASVTSNEPANGHGDGNTATDWEITGPRTVNVRAERSGGGDGRVYTLTVRCTDPTGNASTGTTTVTVAH